MQAHHHALDSRPLNRNHEHVMVRLQLTLIATLSLVMLVLYAAVTKG